MIARKLLIAEDEPDPAEAPQIFFEKNQFTVDTVFNGADAYAYAQSGGYDALILDVMMPKLNGLAVVRQLRAQGFAGPIMLLTARGEKDNRVEGFDAGADDSLPKPFAPDELLSRVRALLRRTGGCTPTVLTFSDLALDCTTGLLSCGRQAACLSGREFQVMELLLRAPARLFPAEEIMERVWGRDSDAEIHVVWAHISNLRKKLQAIGSRVTIRAKRSMGYRLEEKP